MLSLLSQGTGQGGKVWSSTLLQELYNLCVLKFCELVKPFHLFKTYFLVEI